MKLTSSTAAALAAALLALTAAGCGETTRPGAADQALATPPPDNVSTEVTPTTAATSATTPAPTGPGGGAVLPISKDLKKKPAIPKPKGDPPSELVIKDIVVGKGKAAKTGSNVTVKYVGVSYATGKQFDSSWDKDMDFPFELGAGAVIPGWDEGVVGMKEGGRRELVIPPDKAYGAEGQPPTIGPNETLVFVIDLVKA